MTQVRGKVARTKTERRGRESTNRGWSEGGRGPRKEWSQVGWLGDGGSWEINFPSLHLWSSAPGTLIAVRSMSSIQISFFPRVISSASFRSWWTSLFRHWKMFLRLTRESKYASLLSLPHEFAHCPCSVMFLHSPCTHFQQPFIHRTPVVTSNFFNRLANESNEGGKIEIYMKCENFQKVNSDISFF